MKLARVAVLGVALGAGTIAAVLALNLTSSDPAPDPVAEVRTDTVEVLVASRDLPMGTTLSEDSVSWQVWPRSGALDRFIVRSSGEDVMEQAVGAIARASLYEGEPISTAK